jgi:hypothetical protein
MWSALSCKHGGIWRTIRTVKKNYEIPVFFFFTGTTSESINSGEISRLAKVIILPVYGFSIPVQGEFGKWHPSCTVRKMDLILRSIGRRPQMQLSMARRFKLRLLRRYSVKFSKKRNVTLSTPWLGKLKNTGGRRTNILWICSLHLLHCATGACDIPAFLESI